MCQGLRLIMTAAVLVAVSSAAIAGVVRDQTGNPGVQTGGHTLPSHAAPQVPHSLIGALTGMSAWPWGWFSSFPPFPVSPITSFDGFSPFANLAPFDRRFTPFNRRFVPFRRVVPFHRFGGFAAQHRPHPPF